MAEVYDTSEFRNGLKIEIDGEPFEIISFQHVKPGKGSAFCRLRIRSLTSGRTLEPTLKSGEKVGKPDMEEKEMQYLYREGEQYQFMDVKNYEQTFLTEAQLGESKKYLKENINAHILFWNGKALAVELPNAVDLTVTKCDPGARGDTVSGALKPATLETGHTINVPLFVNEGDILRVDTRSGEYLTRVG